MNYMSGLWDCKNCGLSGNWFQFFRQFKSGLTLKKDKRENLFNLETDLNKRKKQIDSDEEKKPLRKKIELPFHFKRIKRKDSYFYKYLKNRRYKLEDIKKYNLMFTREGKYFNRIIIPVIYKNKNIAFLGRWIDNKNLGEEKRKYLNSYGSDFSTMFWNYDNIDNSKPVIICEGVFSAMRIGFNSIASFGKKLSDEQIRLLNRKKVKEIILLFDSDAISEIIKIYNKKFIESNIKVRIMLFKSGDPDDLDNSDNKLYDRILESSKILKPKDIVDFNKVFKKNGIFIKDGVSEKLEILDCGRILRKPE